MIAVMTDEEVKSFIPSLGHRVAVRHYIQSEREKNPSAAVTRKLLISRLRQKLNLPAEKDESGNSVTNKKHLLGNSNARKDQRKIEFGWKHNSKTIYKRFGGGTRKVDVKKDTRKSELLQIGIGLFFPAGKSKMGKIEEFSVNLCDYSEVELPEDVTVGQIYDEAKLGTLKFYLTTENKNENRTTEKGSQEDGTVSEEVHVQKRIKTSSTSNDQEKGEPEGQVAIMSPVENMMPIQLDLLQESDDIVMLQIQEIEVSAAIDPQVYDTGISEATNPATTIIMQDLPATTIRLHRVTIMEEMITIFKSEDIMTTRLFVQLVDEVGADQSGVSREAYTEFWKGFLAKLAEGEDVRVPAICPQYGLEEWKAIARVLAKGMIDAKVFPLQIAKAFIMAVFFGEESVPPEDLMSSFLLYLSEYERKAVESLLKGTGTEEEKDIVIDILDREGSHQLPENDGYRPILLQTAHKCIIQNSAYALEAMRLILPKYLGDIIKTSNDINKLYDQLKPTVANVIQLFNAPDSLNKEESKVFGYLKQYIRSQNDAGLISLLQFLTASRVLSVSKIDLQFVKMTGLQRRPIAHTCGPMLELAVNYGSYRELRAEFDAILGSGYLNMDIA